MAAESPPDHGARTGKPDRPLITYQAPGSDGSGSITLPFVVGVLADLSGQRLIPLAPVKDRKFISIDRDNFREVFQAAAPRLMFRIPDRIGNPDNLIDVELHFQSIEDFEPPQVLKQAGFLEAQLRGQSALDLAVLAPQFSAQIDEILHHPAFRSLEAAWRGLHYLVHQTETGSDLKIKVWNVAKTALLKDLDRAFDYQHCSLYCKVYDEELGSPGGQPFGVLIGDYEFGCTPEDLGGLSRIAEVAAAAHAPFVASASPKMFGNITDYSELDRVGGLTGVFANVKYASWNSFRENPNSRYVALTLPPVLARLPYGPLALEPGSWRYEELADGSTHGNYLWMSSAWAFAARLTAAFAREEWLENICGEEGGGKVNGLPVQEIAEGQGGKRSAEWALNDRQAHDLAELGFLPLLQLKAGDCVFVSANSCHKAKRSYDAAATRAAELSIKLNYLLCAARIVHYMKVLARLEARTCQSPAEYQDMLNAWLSDYVLSDTEYESGETPRGKLFLDARVELREGRGKGTHRLPLILLLAFASMAQDANPVGLRVETNLL